MTSQEHGQANSSEHLAAAEMGAERRPATLAYYDDTYHREHYGYLFDESYYRLVAAFWRHALFEKTGLDINSKVLDYGCGLGQVSAALPDSVCFDVSRFAIANLRGRGRTVIDAPEKIPIGAFDIVLSSHSLEHSATPYEDLKNFRQYLRPGGHLLLVLPIEIVLKPAPEPDWNQHLFAWTFQTITNLLRATGWIPILQKEVNGPFLLRKLSRFLSERTAVRGAYAAGKIRNAVPSLLTIARLLGIRPANGS